MRNTDFSPYRSSTVGFDRLFDLLQGGSPSTHSENYPPFDLEQDGHDHYRITLAVAGFGHDEIEITAKQNQLVITGRKSECDDRNFIHRGIATRSFERNFVLGDYVQVRSTEMKDGLLTINLQREIPDEVKPRKIEIRGSTQSSISDRIIETSARRFASDIAIAQRSVGARAADEWALSASLPGAAMCASLSAKCG
jgi:molecular chaperone IbpA